MIYCCLHTSTRHFHQVNCCSLDVSSSSDQRWLCGMNPRRSAVSEIQHQQPRPIQSHLNHCFSTFSSPVWTPAAHPNHVHGVAMWAMWLANYIIVLMKSWTGVPIKAAIMDMIIILANPLSECFLSTLLHVCSHCHLTELQMLQTCT